MSTQPTFRTIIALLVLLMPLTTSAQKMPADYFEEAEEYYDNENYKKAIKSYKSIIKANYKDDLWAMSHYNLASCYLQLNNDKKAISQYKYIINSNVNDAANIGTNDIMGNPFANYKHNSASILSNIYFKMEEYDSALHYLSLSDTVYRLQHFCGNAYAAEDIYLANRYAEIYLKKGDTTRAESYLIPCILDNGLADNSDIITTLKDIYSSSNYNKDELKKELETAINNVIQCNGSNYCINFRGHNIRYHDWRLVDNNDIEEVKKELRKTAIYQMIMNL